MRKLLFVIPGLGIGGTNSSLESLYNHICKEYDVQVFAISYHTKKRDYSFNKALLPTNKVLSFLFTDYSVQRGLNKLKAFVYKVLQSCLRLFGIDLMSIVAKRVVKRIENSNEYDCVVAFQEGFATRFVSWFHNNNRIAWIHCDYSKWCPNGSELGVYNRFNQIVCVSKYTASVFKGYYTALKDRVVAIHNLLDIERLSVLSQQNDLDIHIGKDKFIILSAGRFSEVKRFREIPRIAFSIKQNGGDFAWYIIGPDGGGLEMKHFEDNLKKYNIGDCVQWLGGKDNPYPYFKSASLYACTSESEACPMVFAEAKYFGLPIVTVDFPSAYEFVNDSTGKIVKLDDMACAIAEIMRLNTGTIYNADVYDEEELIMAQLHHLFN